jgi:hypothetical protein
MNDDDRGRGQSVEGNEFWSYVPQYQAMIMRS